jgi:hydrophobic/amphiphilic exporter-1 (mainly G- bacteria), HAE1 family
MSIASFSVRRRVTVFMVTIGVVVFGFFSFNRLELQLLPEISYPSLTVRTEMEGAPPEEIENLISRPIEEALGIVSNLQQITSVSRAGMSDVIVEFHWQTTMDKALMEVREKLDGVLLPDSSDRPRILRYNPETEPIMTLALTGNDLIAMYSLADLELKPKLETLPGVAAIRIMGGDKEEIQIELDTRRLATLGLTLADVSRRLSMENINLPGGMLQEGDSRFLVRTLNEFQTEESIGDIVVSSGTGINVRLKDIATIHRTTVERRTITQLNGRPSVIMDVYKEGDANIINVADVIRHQVKHTSAGPDAIRQTALPENMTLEIISDQSTFIRAAINEVRTAAILGSLLAVAVIYIFLRHVPNTLIIGLSIPISIVATFSLMYFRGITLNLMSLGGLALGIGMLVDNSIVVLENIFRTREKGLAPTDASRTGTEQVTTAVIASTLTTIAVFFPIIFVTGIAGQLFNDLAWTIAFSLLASLIVALSFIPMLASLGRKNMSSPEDVVPILSLWRQGSATWRDIRQPARLIKTVGFVITSVSAEGCHLFANHMGQPFRKIKRCSNTLSVFLTILVFPFRFIFQGLKTFLHFSAAIFVNASWLLAALPIGIMHSIWKLFKKVTSPFLAMFNTVFTGGQRLYSAALKASLRQPFYAPATALVLLVVIALLVVPKLGMNLIPTMSQGEFFIDIQLPVGSPLEETQSVVSGMESVLNGVSEIGVVSSVIGSDVTTSTSLGAEMEHIASIQIILEPEFRNQISETRVINQLRSSLKDISGIRKLDFRRPALFAIRSPLVVEVRGNNLDSIMTAADQLAEFMRRDTTFTDVVTSMESGYPEIQVEFDRIKLARFGMTPNDAAVIMRNAIEGDVPTRFGLVGEEIDIRVRADRSISMTPEDLRRVVINPRASSPVYLSSVAKISHSVGPSETRRVGRRRVALVTAETPLLDLHRAAGRVEDLIRRQPSVYGVSYAVTGQTEEMRESTQSLIIALIMAVFLVYLVMASQFESLLQPLLILFSIPLGFIGVIAGLHFFQISLSVVVFIGLIVLAGIVVNNAIVLVDTTNQLIRNGTATFQAVQMSAMRRFRPILMTALTTVLGLLPMALSTGPGEEIRRPLAITIILGLIVSTFLTLILIPTLYSLLYRKSGDMYVNPSLPKDAPD